MVIGISGKLGSGKDTVGLAIQTLMDDSLTKEERLEILEGKLAFPPGYHPNGWQIKKMLAIKGMLSFFIRCLRRKNSNIALKMWSKMLVR